jgi:conjugal transfer/entry exclusion protein
MDNLEENEGLEKKSINLKDKKSNNNFLDYLNEVNFIIGKLEVLENEKNKLKDQLKNYEQEFLNKKIKTEDKINSLSKEKEMLDKTINLIKNLKKF